MRYPVTVAEGSVLLSAGETDALADLLMDAATVIGHLAGHPAAEAALAAGGCGPAADCAELTLDLRVAAGQLSDDLAARRVNDLLARNRREYAGQNRERQEHARKEKHSEPDF
jgi:hypothetical protein